MTITQDMAASTIEVAMGLRQSRQFSHRTWDQNAVGSSVSLGPDSVSASVSPPVSQVLLVGASSQQSMPRLGESVGSV